MNLLKATGVKKAVLPNTKRMLPRLSDMHGIKRSQFKLYKGGKRKRKMTIGRMIRGGVK